ncbi:MAG: NADH-quinone oxidoreductase subunit N [Pseudomonadota bacterium]
MLSNADSLVPFAPEFALAVGILLVLGGGLVFPGARRLPPLALTLAALAAAAVATVVTRADAPRGLFGGLLARDSFADYFKLLFVLACAFVSLAAYRARDVLDPADGDRDAAEFSALLLAVILGASLMAAAADLLTAYLALELVSIMSYVLTGFSRRSRRSAEAALKYAIYGGVATAALLYGFSLLFGLAGSTDLAAIRNAAATAPPLTVAVAVTLCLAGFGFKMGIVPFHMWAPDVYEGAPTAVAAFFSVVPKAAGFALAYRFLLGASTNRPLDADVARLVSGTGPAAPWALVVGAVAGATMTLGNLAALGQRNVKRLLAYSSIAHAGTILMALAVGTPAAAQAMLLYLGVYLFMNLAAFLVVVAAAEQGVGEDLADFAGLAARAPFAAFCLVVSLIALTGLPPTAGFVAKYALFAAVVGRGMDGGGAPFLALAAVGVANTVVSLYYYARIARTMYFDPPPASAAVIGLRLRLAPLHIGLVGVCTAPVVGLGVYATPLSSLIARSVELWAGR